MRSRGTFRVFCVTSGRLIVAAGAAAVLLGLARVLSPKTTRTPKRNRTGSARPAVLPRPFAPPLFSPAELAPADVPVITPLPLAKPTAPAQRVDYFHIRRTRSQFGHPHWVLQGFGRHRCFILFDTWREAMDEAALRLNPAPVLELPHASHLAAFAPRAALLRQSA